MAKPKRGPYPVTYKVVNEHKRSRFRAGRKIPGAQPDKRYEPVEVTVRGRGEELQLTTTRGLKCSKVQKSKGKGSGSGKGSDSKPDGGSDEGGSGEPNVEGGQGE